MSGTANARADVYAIPADWASRPLGELATVGAGGTPSREVQAYWNGSIPWITTSQIDFNRIKAAEQFITEEGLRNSSAKLVPPGTLLLALYGQGKTRGKVGILDIEAATNQACASIVPHASVSGDFLFHFLANRYEAIRNASNSGGQENLSSSIVKGIEVHVPEIREQQAIADVLSDVDFLLASLDELVTKKRDLKQAAMQQLLTGRRRLTGFCSQWSLKRVGEFADCIAGGTPNTSTPKYWGGQIRWMNSGELNLKRVSEVAGRITDEGLKNSSAKIVPARCVLIGLAGQGKTRGTVAMNLVPLCTNQSIAAVLPNSGFVSEYLYYNLDLRYDELRGLSTGDGGRGGLNLTIIRGIAVPFPELAEQRAIAEVLAEMDSEIARLQARHDKIQTVKQAMMQQLLTGRIRLT